MLWYGAKTFPCGFPDSWAERTSRLLICGEVWQRETRWARESKVAGAKNGAGFELGAREGRGRGDNVMRVEFRKQRRWEEELKGMSKWEVWGKLICTSSQMSHDLIKWNTYFKNLFQGDKKRLNGRKKIIMAPYIYSLESPSLIIVFPWHSCSAQTAV